MDKYKNVFLSLGFFVVAPLWIFLWLSLGRELIMNPPQSHVVSTILYDLYIWPYFIFFVIAIFFGYKNLKADKSILVGNIITLLEIIALLLSVAYYFWATAWMV